MRARPTATYRLQFHRAFTFAQARDLVPYLARLGISHVYASPIFRAAPGSMHAGAPVVGAAIRRGIGEWNDPADAARFDRLDRLLSDQAYRLSLWRVAGEEINCRRFFDVNSLAAIRVELPEVFDATHRLLFELIDAGHVAGLRIDHIDGLAFPRDYLARLRDRAGESLYLLVEKILGPEERLRADWPVDGTTGYEFANQLVKLLIAATARPRFVPDPRSRVCSEEKSPRAPGWGRTPPALGTASACSARAAAAP